MDSGFWVLQFLNALQYSMLLFLLSIGLTVILGLLHFVNLAHGALYMMGAYIGVSVAAMTGSYWAAFALAPLGVTAKSTDAPPRVPNSRRTVKLKVVAPELPSAARTLVGEIEKVGLRFNQTRFPSPELTTKASKSPSPSRSPNETRRLS